MPVWFRFVYFTLYPDRLVFWWVSRKGSIRYDYPSNTIRIGKVKFSVDALDGLATAPVGTTLRIMKRHEWGDETVVWLADTKFDNLYDNLNL